MIGCTDAGVASEPLAAGFADGRLTLKGRLGVFAPGAVFAEALDGSGRSLAEVPLQTAATPLKPVLVDASFRLEDRPASLRLLLRPFSPLAAGGELARVSVR